MRVAARLALTGSIVVAFGLFGNLGKAVEPAKGPRCYYPPRAYKRHAEGTVVVQFEITAEGLVRDVSVEKSSGDLALNKTAVTCAERWVYLPARRNSKPIAVRDTVNVIFDLPNSARVEKAPTH